MSKSVSSGSLPTTFVESSSRSSANQAISGLLISQNDERFCLTCDVSFITVITTQRAAGIVQPVVHIVRSSWGGTGERDGVETRHRLGFGSHGNKTNWRDCEKVNIYKINVQKRTNKHISPKGMSNTI